MAGVEMRVVLLYIGEHRKKIAFCGSTLGNLIKAVRQNSQLDTLIPEQEGILFQIWDDDFKEFVDLENNFDVPHKSKIKVIKIKDPRPISPPLKSSLELQSNLPVNSELSPVLLDSFSSLEQKMPDISKHIIQETPKCDVEIISSNHSVLEHQPQILTASQLMMTIQYPFESIDTNEIMITDHFYAKSNANSGSSGAEVTSSRTNSGKWKPDIFELPKFSSTVQEIIDTKEFLSQQDYRAIINEIKQFRYPEQYFSNYFWHLLNKYPHLRDSSSSGYSLWVNNLKTELANEKSRTNTIKDRLRPKNSRGKVKYKRKKGAYSQSTERNEQFFQSSSVLSRSSGHPDSPINCSAKDYKIPEFSLDIREVLESGEKPSWKVKRAVISELFQHMSQYSWYPTKLYTQVFMQLFKKYPYLRKHAGPKNSWLADLKIKFANQRRKLNPLYRKRVKAMAKSYSDNLEEIDHIEILSDKEDSQSISSIHSNKDSNEKWTVKSSDSPSVTTTSNQIVSVVKSSDSPVTTTSDQIVSVVKSSDSPVTTTSNQIVSALPHLRIKVEDSLEEPMVVDSRSQLHFGYVLPQFSPRLHPVLSGDEEITKRHKCWIIEEIFHDVCQFYWYPQNYRQIVSSLLTAFPHLEIDGICFNTWVNDLKMKFANERRKLGKESPVKSNESLSF